MGKLKQLIIEAEDKGVEVTEDMMVEDLIKKIDNAN